MGEVNNASAVSFGLHEGIRRGEDTARDERDREREDVPADSERVPLQAPPRIKHSPVNDPAPAKEPQRVERPNVAAAERELRREE
jgi:hypothetical protein